MSRFLLDTGIAQDFMNRRHGVQDRADEKRRQGHRIGICVPVLGELWSGVEGSASRDRNIQPCETHCPDWSCGPTRRKRPPSLAASLPSFDESVGPCNKSIFRLPPSHSIWAIVL